MKITKQTFTRRFDESRKEYIEDAWFAVSHKIINRQLKNDGYIELDIENKAKKIRRKSHGKWFKISNGNYAIYRLIKFNPHLKCGDEKSDIAIDWQGFIELSDYASDTPESLNLELKPANFFENIIANMKHPDVAIRTAYRLSLILGLLSLLVSVVQFFL